MSYDHVIMYSRTCFVLLEIFFISAIMMMTVVTDANANTAIQPYNDPPIVPGCGQVHIRNEKIIDGHEASFGSHPWHGGLLIHNQGEWLYTCGSSLLNDRWIVTAAHCLHSNDTLIPNDDLRIRLGEWKIYSTSERFSHADYGAERLEPHPQYNHTILENDIAMVKLNETVSFKQHIVPICLPMSNLDIFGKTAHIQGWGYIRYNEKDEPSILLPDVLQEIDVEVITNEECQKWYDAMNVTWTIHDSTICAGYKEGGRGSCRGDSGGGLTTLVGGKRVLIGIVSWIVGRCRETKRPGGYTYVQKFVPWILNTMK